MLVSRVIEGEPAVVWPALGKAFEAERCGLQLLPSSHAHPTRTERELEALLEQVAAQLQRDAAYRV